MGIGELGSYSSSYFYKMHMQKNEKSNSEQDNFDNAVDQANDNQSASTNGISPCRKTYTLIGTKELKCPYQYLAKDGVIEYNGVTFVCDYKRNTLNLGDVDSDPKKVLKISLPSGGNLKVNVDNLEELARASGMFSPDDLNAIMRAIQTYKHCTSKAKEIEDELNKSPEETAETEKPAEVKRAVAAEQMRKYSEELYLKLVSDSGKDNLPPDINLDYEERLSEEELARRIDILLEDTEKVK